MSKFSGPEKFSQFFLLELGESSIILVPIRRLVPPDSNRPGQIGYHNSKASSSLSSAPHFKGTGRMGNVLRTDGKPLQSVEYKPVKLPDKLTTMLPVRFCILYLEEQHIHGQMQKKIVTKIPSVIEAL